MEELRLEVKRVGRSATILSQRMNKKNSTATKEMRDPIDEIAFQAV